MKKFTDTPLLPSEEEFKFFRISLTKLKNCTNEIDDLVKTNINMCANNDYIPDEKYINKLYDNIDLYISDNNLYSGNYEVINILESNSYSLEKNYFLEYLFISYSGVGKNPNFSPVK